MSPPFLRSSRRAMATLCGLTMLAADVLFAAPATYEGPFKVGTLEAPPRHETSGLAISRRDPGILWTHDDSGGAPVLYALDTTGKKRGAVRVRGVKNEDWEDIASFKKDGLAWLLIADVGDNDADRKTVRVHIIEEPAPDRLKPQNEIEADPHYTLRIRFQDGPRDCEAVAVDPVDGGVYFLTKRDNPPRLYRAPLGEAPDKIVEARLIGPVPAIIGHTQIDAIIKRVVGKKYSWPTGMDFAPDGRAAVVLTYGEPLVFQRQANEPWAEAFKRPPTRLLFHGLPQAEGICFSADSRSIYVASEEAPALARYDREGP